MTWANFSRDEFKCSHCGENQISDDLIDLLQDLRNQCDFAFRISSGYRCFAHPIEARKAKPGTHSSGLAADIAVSHGQAFQLVKVAMADERTRGLGVNQKGDSRFIHIDISEDGVRPSVWSY